MNKSKFLTGREIELPGKILITHHQRTRINSTVLKSLKNPRIRSDAERISGCHERSGLYQLSNNAKNPILVLQKATLAEIVIQQFRRKIHPRVSHTMAIVRQEYWIPKLRSQVLQIVCRCVLCQKLNNLPYQYPF